MKKNTLMEPRSVIMALSISQHGFEISLLFSAILLSLLQKIHSTGVGVGVYTITPYRQQLKLEK